ncbi:hypothetical protein HY218_00020 [Candidatus Saccharibacteria bacterium]|nr:hypothetical protein [Candidatus Saccharibacteria bacterium]
MSKPRPRPEPDSVFLLKMVMYLVIGAQWLRIVNPSLTREIPLPVGLVIGLLFAMHDHFRLDRKIEFGLLLAAMLVGFWSQAGIYLTLLK